MASGGVTDYLHACLHPLCVLTTTCDAWPGTVLSANVLTVCAVGGVESQRKTEHRNGRPSLVAIKNSNPVILRNCCFKAWLHSHL